jgi:hypothetical protein
VQTTCSLVRVSGLAADRAVGRLAQPLIEPLLRRAARLLAPWAAALPRRGT